MRRALYALALPILLCACTGSPSTSTMTDTPPSPAAPGSLTSEPFGTLPDGTEATLYTLTSASGARMRVTDYGGIIVSLEVPDREGDLGDVVLGFEALEGYTSDAYLQASPYFGPLIGRYGNRIAGGRFELDGEVYQLATNDGANHLHGGDVGFDKVMWSATPFQVGGDVGLRLRRISRAGEEGYPGALDVTVTYTLTRDDRLVIGYEATTDAPTVVNLTQHTYFNLTGEPSNAILDHELTIHAGAFTPVDAGLIPTGEIRPVAGTPFDFRRPTPIGSYINADDEQITLGPGYDHNFVLAREGADGNALVEAARVYEPTTGRLLVVETTEPALQFYSGNLLDGSLTGKDGIAYERRSGFCLETQHYPDSPNQPAFPSTELRPGETYASQTVYTFRTRDEGATLPPRQR